MTFQYMQKRLFLRIVPETSLDRLFHNALMVLLPFNGGTVRGRSGRCGGRVNTDCIYSGNRFSRRV